MKIIVIIVSTFLLLLGNWAKAIVPINQTKVGLVKLIDFKHFTKGKINNESQIINLIEDLDIDSEEDNTNDNGLKLNKVNKYLSQNLDFLSNQNLNYIYNHKSVLNNTYSCFPEHFVNSNPIYILISNLRI